MRTAKRKPSILILGLTGILSIGLAATSVHAEPEVQAAQGQVVVWPGDDAIRCGMDGRTWPALEGRCYYPIDMDHHTGRFETGRWRAVGGMERGWIDIVEKDYGEQDIDFPDDRYVHPPANDLAEHYRQQVLVKRVLRARPTEARFRLPLGKPANPLPAGDGFGVRRTFNGEPKNRHTGTDYPIGTGNPVRSVANGTVVLTGEHFFAGNSVYVDHGLGLISMYFHLSEIDSSAGDSMPRGDAVGKIGSTGRSTGPHLHLGLRWLGARIDPEQLFEDPSQLPTLSD